MTVEAEVPASTIELARRRTEFLFRHMQYGDSPLRMILASAYVQGMNDMFDTLEARGLLRKSAR